MQFPAKSTAQIRTSASRMLLESTKFQLGWL